MSQSVKTVRQPLLARHIARFLRGSEEPIKVRYSTVKLGAHFTRRVNLLGLAIVFGAYKFAHHFVPAFGGELPSGFAPGIATEFAPGSSEYLVLQAGIVLLALVGVRLLYAGLTGARALSITPDGISAFHVYGTQTMPWRDIAKIELRHDYESYGKQLLIHAAWGSRSMGLVRGIVPIYLGRIDTPLEDILAAIHAYRPDLTV